LHPEDAARIRAERAQIFQSGHHATDYRLRHKDGSYRWVRDDARVILDQTGTPVEIIGSWSDISVRKSVELEQQKMEVQLRQAQKLEAIGQLAAGIAHEINTPTQYVGDNTRFFKDSFENIRKVLKSHEELIEAAKKNAVTPEVLERAQTILAESDLEYLFEQVPAAINETLEGVERVTKIVRAMKEFSHPGGKEKSPADLNKAIESTVTVARNEWKYLADMTLNFDPHLPSVPCFLGEFNQVILNLVINASHAIADVVKEQPNTKGKITISTRRDGDAVEVRVGDSGTGIPENVRARIFEPFFTTKPVGKGTGQGLSIVYTNIVKKHGGSVTFETQPGQGTTFIIRLPLAPHQ
jgi:signal transduction histidine kinase